MGWFNVMTEFIVVRGRKDGVDLILIYRHVVIFVERFGQEQGLKVKKVPIIHDSKV